jgi:hypothetical protein
LENVLIHIGYHKTGTTWLQNELFVPQNDIFLPLSRSAHDEGSLATHFIYDEAHYLLNSFDSNENVIKRELNFILNNDSPEDKVLVMSHERLSGNPHSSGIGSYVIARRIQNIFPKAKILIVLREQKSFVVSNYFQYLSAGGTHNIKKYLNTRYDGKRPGFSPNFIDYHPLISGYQELFGSENILVLPYELFKSDSVTFLENISRFIGKKIEVDDASLSNVWNKKEHFFLNYHFRFLNFFKISSSLNNHSFLANKVSKLLATLLYQILVRIIPDSLNKWQLKRINSFVRSWVSDRYVDSNKKVSALINLDLERYGYY